MRLNSMLDSTFFAGFRSNLTAPTWSMTESCSGLFLNSASDNGALYFHTADGDATSPRFQRQKIADIDMTRYLVFQIRNNAFRYYTLPVVVPYFDENVEEKLKDGLVKKWSPWYTNGNVMPADQAHWIFFYIKNNIGMTRYLEINNIFYGETYAD